MEQVTAPAAVAAVELLAIPTQDITSRQARGADCVWCADPLTAGGAVLLGERVVDSVRQFPRGCRPCTARKAMGALQDHAPGCSTCRTDGRGCDHGHALQRLIKQGRAAA
ncbi:hypothetical protein ABZY09_37825 [Streptomyces sp. NPDC002928]|uniref:hypothetical protein n=1 Tax=Streptomyces sp. NPDC002928 TaxID=3154440 RepID=UPI0033BEAA1C